MARQVELDTEAKPPTPEERERALAAIERIRRRHVELLAARDGRWFPSAADVLREARGETDEETT